jgi:hypothetical protein
LDRAEITTNSEKTNRWPNCFQLYSKVLDRGYYFAGDSSATIKNWIRAIQQASSATSVVTQSIQKSGGRRRFNDEMDGDMSESPEDEDLVGAVAATEAVDRPERRPSTMESGAESTPPKKRKSKSSSKKVWEDEEEPEPEKPREKKKKPKSNTLINLDSDDDA